MIRQHAVCYKPQAAVHKAKIIMGFFQKLFGGGDSGMPEEPTVEEGSGEGFPGSPEADEPMESSEGEVSPDEPLESSEGGDSQEEEDLDDNREE